MQMASDRQLTNLVFGDPAPYEEMRRLYSIAYASVATLRNVEVARRMRPAKIFPSLSCGVPVIYAGPGEAAELIERHGCGVAVPPEDAAALAAAIERIASDPAEREALGRRGRNFVAAEYSWSGIVTRWLAEVGCSQQ
jgi:glycosyltransferase involved in cell wall biosynthesis